VSIFDVQIGMRIFLESLLRNKHIDLIIFCTVSLGFMAMLIMSAISS
jgi:hypothetical protein